MATKQQLEEGIRRAHAAGDANAVRILGQQLRSLQEPETKSKRFTTFSDAVGSFTKKLPAWAVNAVTGFPEGVERAVDVVADPIAEQAMRLVLGDKKAKEAIRRQQLKSKARYNAIGNIAGEAPIARDIGRATGALAVIPIPGRKLQEGGKIARAAYRAMQGAVGGAAVSEPENRGESIAVGTAANVVLPPIISTVAKPIAAAGSKFLKGFAKPTETPIDLLGKEAAERAARFEELGIKNPTTAMITRDPTAWEFEQGAAQSTMGGKLARQMRNVQASLLDEGNKFIEKFSVGKTVTPEETGLASQKFLESKQKEVQDLTTKLYEEVQTTRGDELIGRMSILREKITEPSIMHDADYSKVLKSVKNYMKDLGLISKDGRISQGINLNQAENLRKFIGGLGNGANPKIRRLRAILVDAVDDDVVDVVGDDAFKAARANAKAGFEEFKKTYAGKVIEENIPPESVVDRLFKAPLSDIRSFKRSHLTGTPEQIAQGEEAWRGIKAQVADDLILSARDVDGRLLGRNLLKTFSDNSAKFKEIYSPEEYKQLQNLVIASKDVTSAPVGLRADDTSAIADLFQSVPPKVREGWFKFLTKTSALHSAAYATGGPLANVAVVGGQHVATTSAEKKAAELFIRRMELASDPKAAAKAIEEARRAARTNPIIRDFLEKRGIIGATAAAASGE